MNETTYKVGDVIKYNGKNMGSDLLIPGFYYDIVEIDQPGFVGIFEPSKKQIWQVPTMLVQLAYRAPDPIAMVDMVDVDEKEWNLR